MLTCECAHRIEVECHDSNLFLLYCRHLLQILKYVSADCTAVNLRIDGTWSEVSNIPAKSKCTKKNVQTECITLDDSIIIEESLQVGKLGDTEIECITLDDSIIDYK